MIVTTSNFEEMHGSKPKPSQHGLWTFMIERALAIHRLPDHWHLSRCPAGRQG